MTGTRAGTDRTQELAEFVATLTYEDLPAEVADLVDTFHSLAVAVFDRTGRDRIAAAARALADDAPVAALVDALRAPAAG